MKNRSFPIAAIGIFFSVLFAAMLIYICHYAWSNRRVLADNSYNARTELLSEQNRRGGIYAAGGERLAYSEDDDAGNERRIYPYGRKFAHVVGFATHGRMGVERLTNYELLHTTAKLSERAAAAEEGAKNPGCDVYTSLDVHLQETAYEALAAYRGAVIVTDIKTGAILAMVSKPDFDPSEIGSQWSRISKDTDASPLLNRVTQGLYPPGSTFKIVTTLEYLREHDNETGGYSFDCTGSFTAGDEVIHCFHGQLHGRVDLTASFAKSCNSSFANIGMTLDRQSFGKTLEDLMFNEELPMDWPLVKSGAVCGKDTPDSDVMQLSIGQGTTGMSPVHMNMITSAIANKGVLMRPYVVTRITGSKGETISAAASHKEKILMSEKEAETLTALMRNVVTNGTGRVLKDSPYEAAGKTGSAEFMDSGDDSHAWFTGFAPASKPEIAVTVLIENAGSGGEYAAPIAKRLFDAYFGVE